jgi:small subunit ribosomal protein S17
MVKKTKEGIIVSRKMKDTCVVVVQDRVSHKRYKKVVIKTKRYSVQDTLKYGVVRRGGATKIQSKKVTFDLAIGDKVLIRETRPISKTKVWVVVSVLKYAKS